MWLCTRFREGAHPKAIQLRLGHASIKHGGARPEGRGAAREWLGEAAGNDV